MKLKEKQRILKIINDRITYGKKYRLKNKDQLRNGWSGIESGPCCDKCRMDKDAVIKSGRAVSFRLILGCLNPFQIKKICECHLPFRKVAEESIQKALENLKFNIERSEKIDTGNLSDLDQEMNQEKRAIEAQEIPF